MYDSVGGWHTVSYFNRVGYEQDRYAKVVGMLSLNMSTVGSSEANEVFSRLAF